MFIEIRDNRYSPPPPKKQNKLEAAVNPVLTSLACAATLGVVVLMSQQLNPTDVGKTYQAAQIPTMMQAEVVRIQNDPHMPPQAKRMALGALAAHGVRVPNK
jgi:hypothetical protein